MRRIGPALALALAACSGSGSSTTTAQDNLVTNAVTSAQDMHQVTVDCFHTFQTCIDSASSDTDVANCQEALKSCLPAPPNGGSVPDLCNPPPPRPGDHDGDGDHHACNGDGGMLPPPPPPPANVDGGLPPPPPPGGDRDGDHLRPPFPISPAGHIALATCHAELEKCLAAGTAATTCTTAAHSCVHDALVADFKALCDAVSTQCATCATSPVCVKLTAQCAAGLTFPDAPASN